MQLGIGTYPMNVPYIQHGHSLPKHCAAKLKIAGTTAQSLNPE